VTLRGYKFFEYPVAADNWWALGVWVCLMRRFRCWFGLVGMHGPAAAGKSPPKLQPLDTPSTLDRCPALDRWANQTAAAFRMLSHSDLFKPGAAPADTYKRIWKLMDRGAGRTSAGATS
jgi:hypothetical protein